MFWVTKRLSFCQILGIPWSPSQELQMRSATVQWLSSRHKLQLILLWRILRDWTTTLLRNALKWSKKGPKYAITAFIIILLNFESCGTCNIKVANTLTVSLLVGKIISRIYGWSEFDVMQCIWSQKISITILAGTRIGGNQEWSHSWVCWRTGATSPRRTRVRDISIRYQWAKNSFAHW